MVNCKACGAVFDEDDLDFAYPANREHSKWNASCPCCSMFVTGNTRDEAITKWNDIDTSFIIKFWKEETQWRKRNNTWDYQ